MKYAIISPISHLNYSDKSTIHMSLTHVVLSNEIYASYYRAKSQAGEYVILDNSAFELEQKGIGVGIEKVLEAAEKIDASEIILTDVLYKGAETVRAVRKDIAYLRSKGLLGKYKLMAVAQGTTISEWLACFDILNDIPEVDVIGWSKLACPTSFFGTKQMDGVVALSRIMAVQTLKDRGIEVKKAIHCLGSDDKAGLEIAFHQKFAPYIRSMDSSNLVWYGCCHQKVNRSGNFNALIFDKPDLENEKETTAYMCEDYDWLIQHNINTLLKLLNKSEQ